MSATPVTKNVHLLQCRGINKLVGNVCIRLSDFSKIITLNFEEDDFIIENDFARYVYINSIYPGFDLDVDIDKSIIRFGRCDIDLKNNQILIDNETIKAERPFKFFSSCFSSYLLFLSKNIGVITNREKDIVRIFNLNDFNLDINDIDSINMINSDGFNKFGYFYYIPKKKIYEVVDGFRINNNKLVTKERVISIRKNPLRIKFAKSSLSDRSYYICFYNDEIRFYNEYRLEMRFDTDHIIKKTRKLTIYKKNDIVYVHHEESAGFDIVLKFKYIGNNNQLIKYVKCLV